MNFGKTFFIAIVLWGFIFLAQNGIAAEKFVIMTAGLSIRHTPLYYGQENDFFKDEGLELQMLVIRAGQVGVATLMSEEVGTIAHGGTGPAAATGGLPRQ